MIIFFSGTSLFLPQLLHNYSHYLSTANFPLDLRYSVSHGCHGYLSDIDKSSIEAGRRLEKWSGDLQVSSSTARQMPAGKSGQ